MKRVVIAAMLMLLALAAACDDKEDKDEAGEGKAPAAVAARKSDQAGEAQPADAKADKLEGARQEVTPARSTTILIGVPTFLQTFPRKWTELTRKPDDSLVLLKPCDAGIRTLTINSIAQENNAPAATLVFFRGQDSEIYNVERIRVAEGSYLLDAKSSEDGVMRTFRVTYLDTGKKIARWEGVFASPLTMVQNRYLAEFPREQAPGCAEGGE